MYSSLLLFDFLNACDGVKYTLRAKSPGKLNYSEAILIPPFLSSASV